MTTKPLPRGKYIVRLPVEERERLNSLIQTGRHRMPMAQSARSAEGRCVRRRCGLDRPGAC